MMTSGDFYRMKNGTILRIVIQYVTSGKCKVRKILPCSGRYSSQFRINKPYTYQHWTNIKLIKRHGTRIGTEEILHLLFKEERENGEKQTTP